MTGMQTYPPIRIGLLNALVQLREDYGRDDSIFKKNDCPYDREVIDLLERLFKTHTVERVIEKVVEVPMAEKAGRGRPRKGSRVEDVIAVDEVRELLEELKALKPGEGRELDSQTKIQLIKTRATLIEKAITMQERAFNVKRMSTFMSVVLQVLDECVSENGRDLFLRKIAPYREDE